MAKYAKQQDLRSRSAQFGFDPDSPGSSQFSWVSDTDSSDSTFSWERQSDSDNLFIPGTPEALSPSPPFQRPEVNIEQAWIERSPAEE